MAERLVRRKEDNLLWAVIKCDEKKTIFILWFHEIKFDYDYDYELSFYLFEGHSF